MRVVLAFIGLWFSITLGFTQALNFPTFPGAPRYLASAPLLDINFSANRYFSLGGNLASSVVTTVRNSAETCQWAGGFLTYATANNPCITDLGLASWNTTFNNVIQSGFASGWTGTRSTLTANAATSPDLTANAATLVEDTSNDTHLLVQAVTKAAATRIYNWSIYAKANGRSRIDMQLTDSSGNGAVMVCDLAGQRVGVAAAGLGTPFTALDSGADVLGAWTRCWLQATSNTDTTVNAQVFLDNGTGTGAISQSYTGDGASGVIVFGPQLDNNNGSSAHPFAPSPYIPTAAAAASRSADLITIALATAPLTALNPSVVTLYVNGTFFHAAASAFNQNIFGFDDGTSSNRNFLFRRTVTALANYSLSTGGSNTINGATIGPAITRGVPVTLANAAQAGNQATGAMGTITYFTAAAMPVSPTIVYFGNVGGAGSSCGCFIKRAAIWNAYIPGSIGGLSSQ